MLLKEIYGKKIINSTTAAFEGVVSGCVVTKSLKKICAFKIGVITASKNGTRREKEIYIDPSCILSFKDALVTQELKEIDRPFGEEFIDAPLGVPIFNTNGAMRGYLIDLCFNKNFEATKLVYDRPFGIQKIVGVSDDVIIAKTAVKKSGRNKTSDGEIPYLSSPHNANELPYRLSPQSGDGITYQSSPQSGGGIPRQPYPHNANEIPYRLSPQRSNGITYQSSPQSGDGITYQSSPQSGDGITYQSSPRNVENAENLSLYRFHKHGDAENFQNYGKNSSDISTDDASDGGVSSDFQNENLNLNRLLQYSDIYSNADGFPLKNSDSDIPYPYCSENYKNQNAGLRADGFPRSNISHSENRPGQTIDMENQNASLRADGFPRSNIPHSKNRQAQNADTENQNPDARQPTSRGLQSLPFNPVCYFNKYPQKLVCGYAFLLGRTVGEDIKNIRNEIIIGRGSTITDDVVEKAGAYGKLVELTFNSVK